MRSAAARLQGAVAVALAIFLISLVALRSPFEGYQVTSQLEYTDLGPLQQQAGESSNRIQQLVFSTPIEPQLIANAARLADQQLAIGPDAVTANRISTRQLNDLVARVKVTTATRTMTTDGAKHELKVSLTDRNLSWSIAFVDHLARQLLVHMHSESPDRDLAQTQVRWAKWRVQRSRHYEQKLRFDVERVWSSISSLEPRKRTGGNELTSQPSAAAADFVTTDNSDLSGQNRQAAVGMAKQSSYESPAAEPNSLVDSPGQLTTEYLQLKADLDAATQRRELEEDRLLTLISTGPDRQGGCRGSVVQVIRPARLERQLGGELVPATVATTGLMATTCGLLVFWCLGTTAGQGSRIYSVNQLQALLPLPIVGRISAEPATRKLRRWDRWGILVRGLVIAGELTLVSLLLVFLFTVWRDSTIGQQMLSNPLSTFVHQVGNGVGR